MIGWFRRNSTWTASGEGPREASDEGVVDEVSQPALTQVRVLVLIQAIDLLGLLVTLALGWWGTAAAWTIPAIAIFCVSIVATSTLAVVRGPRIAARDGFQNELRQAQTRLVFSTLFELYAMASVWHAPYAAKIYLAFAFVGLAVMLVPLILFFFFPRRDLFARVFSAISDQCCTTLLLLADQPYAMACWPIYLWVSFGHGFRFGVRSLLYAAGASLVLFCVVIAEVPSWHDRLPLTAGLLFSLITLPLYASVLIRQLHLATASAKKANEAKTRFIAVMSHELRTPLSAMLGTVGVLRTAELNEDQKRLLHLISGSGQSLLSMINELLDFSAIDSGKTHIEIRDVEIYDLLVATVAVLTMAAEEKGLRLGAHIDCQLPRVLRTDSEHVRRIVTNLVWNAIKFTKAGRIDVTFSSVGGGERLLIEVRDTGVGIPPEKQSKIFDPFVQGDDRVERVYEGVGLGLAIVRELVSLHGGRISLKSEVGVGSRFSVELPVKASAEMKPETLPPQTDRVALIAGSGPLAGGGLLEACRGVGLSASFADPDPILLRKSLNRVKGAAVRPVVLLSHRDMALGGRVTPGQFEALAAIIEAEGAASVLVLGEGDNHEATDFYRTRVTATVKAPTPAQLANALYFVDLDSPSRAEPEQADYTPEQTSRILLVEDNATNRFITSRALSEAGHDVEAVPGGDEALNSLEKGMFDVVIMDINMPGLNGFETTKIIRTVNYSDRLRIIGLTADVTSETKRRCLEAGMDLVLTKPASIPVMLKAIDDLVVRGVATSSIEKVTSIESSARFRSRRAPVVDDNGFQRLKDIGGASFITESLTLFLSEAIDLIRDLEQALDAYDRARAYDIFHSLRGISANVGAMRLREAVNTLRDSENLVSNRRAHVQRLRDELSEFQSEVAKRVPELEVAP